MHIRFPILLVFAAIVATTLVATASAQVPSTPGLAAPTGLAVEVAVNVLNTDGSFVPVDHQVVTISLSWQAVPGSSGYEVERSDRPFGQPPTAYKYVDTVTHALGYSEKYQFLEVNRLAAECYRVRAVTDQVVGAYAEKCSLLGIKDGPGRLPDAEVSDVQLRPVFDSAPGGSARIEVSWASTAAETAAYEVERSVVNGIPLQPGAYGAIATVGSAARGADGRFAYVEPSPLTGRLICYRVRAVEGGIASGYAPATCTQGAIGRALGAPDVAGHIDNDKRLYVAGRDTTVLVSGWIPAFCGGSTVRVSFYLRGGGALINTVDEGVPSVVVAVNADGTFQVAMPLPKKFSSIDGNGYPGVAGSCLTAPVVGGQVMLAVLDPIENQGFAGTFVVPAAVLASTGTTPGGVTVGQWLSSLTALADGVECTTVQTAEGPALDGDGNLRIHVGGSSQAAACSREGATISFMVHGETLFETRTLLLGVTQPFANLAPSPPREGPGIVPSAPVAGNSLPANKGSDWPGILGLVLTCGALAGLGFLWRRPSGRAGE